MGFSPTVFEAHNVAGGMLVLGVPEYRLPRDIIRAEIGAIESLGVEIRLNSPAGPGFLAGRSEAQGYEAIFLGIGAHKSRELSIEGVQNDGVLRAIEFLLNVNLGFRVSLGRKVVVIGGGNVAFDVARSVVRQAEKFAGMSEAELRVALHQAAAALEELTAKDRKRPMKCGWRWTWRVKPSASGVPEVHMYCLESLDEIPAAREEIEEAEQEGIQLHTRFGPKRILGLNGKVTGIELIQASRVFDENRRFNPQFIEGSEETVDCDTVVLAIGQAADLAWIQPARQFEADAARHAANRSADHGHITARCFRRWRRGVWPAHHHHRGGRRQARGQIHRQISHRHGARRTPAGPRDHFQHPAIPDEAGLRKIRAAGPADAADGSPHRDRRSGKNLSGSRRAPPGGSLPQMPRWPGVQRRRVHSVRRLRGRLPGVLPAPGGCRPFARQREFAGGLSRPLRPRARSRANKAAIIKDETRCIRCGLCAVRCPTGAITMERVELVPA